MPLGGISKEKGDYTGGDLPWGGSISNPLLGAPALSFYRRKTSLLGCLGAAGTNRKTLERLDFTHENPLHILTCPGARVGGWIENYSSGCLASHDHSGIHPSLRWVNTPAPLISHHSSALVLGLPQLGRELGHGVGGDLHPSQLGGVRAALPGEYSGSALEATWNLDGHQSTTACALIRSESQYKPHLPCGFTTGWGYGSLGEWLSMRGSEDLDPRLHLSKAEAIVSGTRHRWCLGGSLDTRL